MHKQNPPYLLFVASLLFCIFYSDHIQAQETQDKKTKVFWSQVETRSISLTAIYGQQNYQLLGAGFTADSMGSSLNGYAFDWMDRVGSQMLQLEWNTLSVSSKIPTGLVPSETKQRVDQVKLQALTSIHDEKSIYFGYGLFYQARTIQDMSTPNALFLSSRRYGPQISVLWTEKYSETFGGWFDVGLAFPLWFEELEKSSGSLQYSFIAEMQYLFVYHVNEIFDAGLGLKLLMENNKFKHAGTRGTLDADERFYNIEVPLQLRARF